MQQFEWLVIKAKIRILLAAVLRELLALLMGQVKRQHLEVRDARTYITVQSLALKGKLKNKYYTDQITWIKTTFLKSKTLTF